MPRDTKGLSFDESGVCSFCTEFPKQPHPDDIKKGSHSLKQTIEDIKQRGAKSPFDCVVGVSGGMDSTYLLYLLTRKHGLRCLAAYYRTPFTPKQIDDNIKKITSSLSVPLVEMDLSHEYHRQVATYFVRFSKDDVRDQRLVNLACAPCKLLNRELYRIAKQRGVRTIVHGINEIESANIAAGQLMTNKRDKFSIGTNLLRVLVIGSRGTAVLFRHPGVLRYFGLAFKASILYLSPFTAYLRFRYPSIRVVNYFTETEWHEQDLKHILTELGWKLPDGFYSMKKADCTFAHVKNLMTSLASGANYSDFLFSNMVRFGLLERDEALSRLQREGRPPEGPINEAYRTLGLPDDYIKY